MEILIGIGKYWKHFTVITKHKWYVGMECFKIGLYWQGLTHDLSKYSLTEFFISAKHFQGSSSPIDTEIVKKGYSIAWLNHKNKNKHHFQYWIHYNRGDVKPVPMPKKYMKELACDFIGAGKGYDNNSDKTAPLRYWSGQIDKTFIHKNTQDYIKRLFVCYAGTGTLNLTGVK